MVYSIIFYQVIIEALTFCFAYFIAVFNVFKFMILSSPTQIRINTFCLLINQLFNFWIISQLGLIRTTMLIIVMCKSRYEYDVISPEQVTKQRYCRGLLPDLTDPNMFRKWLWNFTVYQQCITTQ